MVSECLSVIAVSLKVGGGVRLMKPAKCTCVRKTLQTQRGRTHGAGCVRQWFRTAKPLGERRYENWNTHTFDAVTANLVGRMHGAPYRGCRCVPLRFEGGRGGERRWENGNTTTKDAITRCQTWISYYSFTMKFVYQRVV